jgi:uncharacterized protein (TIGR02118 family)
MIKVSVFYPYKDGAKFDMDYYLTKHMPLVQKRLGASLKSIAVERGIGGGAPDSLPLFAAMGHLVFDDIGTYKSGMESHGAEIRADVLNFTNIEPIIQVSEVKL